MAGPPAIGTEDLSKWYGASRGIEGVDLQVDGGEVFGFLGPNGAGKTTTIRLLLDLIRPTHGRAEVLGLDTRVHSLEVRRRTGYLPGELKLPARATARALLRHLARLRDGAGEQGIAPLAERLGLELDREIADLSKGNREKVGVVAAFMHDPELLILDEPTSGLDPLRQQDVRELIVERAAEGRTVFLSSHALHEVEQVADRVAIIRAGAVVATQHIAALKERATRRVRVTLAGPVPLRELERIPGVRDVRDRDGAVELRVEGTMDALVKELARHPVQTLTSEESELDEIFLSYYEAPGAG